MSSTPEHLRYTKTHEWVDPSDKTLLRVGITDHAQSALGDIVFVELPTLGAVEAGSDVAVIESVKAASDIYAPISGEVVEVNESLADSPEAINSSAYEQGWLFKIKPSNLADLEALLDAQAYLTLSESH